MGEPAGRLYGRGMVDGRGMRKWCGFFIEAYVTIEVGTGKWKPRPDTERPGARLTVSPLPKSHVL
jgi:hypothetical protein